MFTINNNSIWKIISIAKKYDFFVVCDETYAHIVYNGEEKTHLSEVIKDVPGMALRSISKEYPWPGARCGWIEVFNQDKDNEFKTYINSLIDAKRLEVCSTTLPQLSIPLVYKDPRYKEHLRNRNKVFFNRAQEAYMIFKKCKWVDVNIPKGAFYMTILLKPDVLKKNGKLKIGNPEVKSHIEKIVNGVALDKRFVYYLLGANGICVVPLTGFCCSLAGFRITLLETDDTVRVNTWKTIVKSIEEYVNS